MSSYKALYGKRYRFPIGWSEHGKSGFLGTDLIHQAIQKVKVIQERLKMIQTSQKSYTYVRRMPLDF